MNQFIAFVAVNFTGKCILWAFFNARHALYISASLKLPICGRKWLKLARSGWKWPRSSKYNKHGFHKVVYTTQHLKFGFFWNCYEFSRMLGILWKFLGSVPYSIGWADTTKTVRRKRSRNWSRLKVGNKWLKNANLRQLFEQNRPLSSNFWQIQSTSFQGLNLPKILKSFGNFSWTNYQT